MNYKKLSSFLIVLLPLLSGCTLPGTSQKVDFSSLYEAHTKSQIQSLRTLAEKLGYIGKYETKGSLEAAIDIPLLLLSGSASTKYDAVIEGYGLSQDSRVIFTNPKFSYETLNASGHLLAKEATVISRSGDMYMRYDGIEGVALIEDSIEEILAKYNNVWLALTEKNLLDTLSGSSEEDKIAYQMSQAVGKLKLEDIEMYLTKYPIWKETKSLGNIDGLTKFEVELSTENILKLVNEFSEKSTGKGLSDDAKKSLETSLNEKKVVGTIAYDPKNSKVAHSNFTISATDGSVMSVLLEEGNEGWKLTSTAADSSINFSLTEKGEGYNFVALISEANEEVGRIEANIDFQKEKFTHLDAKLTSKEDGLTLTLEHNVTSLGAFSGKLDAGMGNLSWNGTMGENFSLTSLSVKGAMIGSSLTLDLSPGTGGILRGPLLLKNGDETVISASVGLALNKELIHLILDVTNPESPSIQSHAEIRVEGKREKWDGTIEVPNVTTPFSELSAALEAIAPPETWYDDTTPYVETPSDNQTYEYSISGSETP